MIHWACLPPELIFSSDSEDSSLQEMTVDGVQMQVRIEGQSARIVRLYSFDPNHYLDPRFQPGSTIELPKISN